MTQNQQASRTGGRKRGSPGPVSRWVQHRMNARMIARIRRNRGRFQGMDVLVLHTAGRGAVSRGNRLWRGSPTHGTPG